jgi:hypothetical protein
MHEVLRCLGPRFREHPECGEAGFERLNRLDDRSPQISSRRGVSKHRVDFKARPRDRGSIACLRRSEGVPSNLAPIIRWSLVRVHPAPLNPNPQNVADRLRTTRHRFRPVPSPRLRSSRNAAMIDVSRSAWAAIGSPSKAQAASASRKPACRVHLLGSCRLPGLFLAKTTSVGGRSTVSSLVLGELRAPSGPGAERVVLLSTNSVLLGEHGNTSGEYGNTTPGPR